MTLPSITSVPTVFAGDPAAVALPAGADLSEASRRTGVDLATVVAAAPRPHQAGDVTAVPVTTGAVRTVLLVGTGDGGPNDLRKAAAAAVRAARRHPVLATALAEGQPPGVARSTVETSALAAYRYTRKSQPAVDALGEIRVVSPHLDAVREGELVARAVGTARDLANTPSLEKSPAWLAEQAAHIGSGAGLAVKVWNETDLAKAGFGGLLAVGAGSARPPRLVELDFQPSAASGRHVVLIGKGITFDSGGLSLKSPDSMTAMKTDMSGAAAVIAVLAAAGELGVRDRVTGIVAAAENMPSGAALRPGDVIRHYGGRTVEVLNTDAEGRLVLADALAYASSRWQPDVVIDLATLTGAATTALGRRHAALYSTDDSLRASLVEAGERAGEHLWPMPLTTEYEDALESPIADLRNIADRERKYGAGSIVAALFLRAFAGASSWAHLDIAGPARADKDDQELVKGATGFGVRSLLYWLAP